MKNLSVDTLRSFLGLHSDEIYLPSDWKMSGNRGPGFDGWISPDKKLLRLFWTAKDGVIAAGNWDTMVYADGWDADSVIKAMNDSLTLWLNNDLKGGD